MESTPRNNFNVAIHSGPLTSHCCRLRPGADLVTSLHAMASECSASSAVIVLTAVGSLSSLTLRMANAVPNGASQCRTWNEPLEIVSLVGTLVPPTKQFHLHMAVADATGCVYGGHLMHGTVHTTVELTLGTIASVVFDRVYDPATGYRELVVASSTSDAAPSI